jgi:hypothetical protein
MPLTMGRCRFIATVRKSLEKKQKSIDSEKKRSEQPEGITLISQVVMGL